MGLERWEVRISLVIYIWLIVFERRSAQEPLRCSLPCSIGYTCFRSRHQNRGPECIAMEVYLSLVKGSNHGHSGPGLPHTHTDGHSPRTGQTHSHLFSHHDSRLSRGDVDRVLQTPAGTGTRQQVVVDPNTGQRFALVPLQETNTINEQGSGNSPRNTPNIMPTVQSRENLITSQQSPNLLQQVPKANTFEIQITEPDINPPVSAALPVGPRPVGPLTNNRNKSVLDIINELVKSTSTQTKHIETPQQQNRNMSTSHQHNEDRNTHHQHNRDRNTAHQHNRDRNTAHQHNRDRNAPHQHNSDRSMSLQHNRDRNTAHQHNRDRDTAHQHNRDRNTAHQHNRDRNAPHQHNSDRSTSHQHNSPSRSHRDRGRHGISPAVTEIPNIRTTRETRNHQGSRTGSTSAIMRDDQGYYFMFYPRTGAEGVRVKITRAGFCSRGPPLTGRRCTIRCTSDSQCRDNFKCCPNECGLSCLPPSKG